MYVRECDRYVMSLCTYRDISTKYYQQVTCANGTGSSLYTWPVPGCVMIAEISRRCFKCFDLVDSPQTIFRKNAQHGWAECVMV